MLLLLAMGGPSLGCEATEGEVGSGSDGWREGHAEPPSAQSVPTSSLPTVEASSLVETYLQRLPEPTPAGENVMLHLRLPAPHDPALAESLVRVLGSEQDPLVVYRTDALVSLGHVADSPGPEFFTAFLSLDETELDRRKDMEGQLAESAEPTETVLHFSGRTPVALTTGVPLDLEAFSGGGAVALGPCPIMPTSSLARWEESLMITDLAVVQDPTRTHDACGAPGDPNGVWTFKHLVSEMATGSGMTPEAFVEDWLDQWLHETTINVDLVPTRQQMFNMVIEPWAILSGVSATLTPVTGTNDFTLSLSGPLNLDLSPFRLSAIVNRIDLGATAGGGAYGGGGDGTSHDPLDAGELRFVFGVQDPFGCAVHPFSVIFEYGVPITSCPDVRDWALQWTLLNDPSFATPFDSAWLAHLEGLTQSVVLHGAAPGKGNDNALNQIRTNENALDPTWELREFTLTNEDAFLGTDPPANGPLRPHTVAMTPDDTAFSPPNFAPNVDSFVTNEVVAGVSPSISVLPADCEASYDVPGWWAGDPFRGGNSLSSPPTDHWRAQVNPTDPAEICARHQFSLNTCNGCHTADTATNFLHVDVVQSPAGLSDFLTGGGGVLLVPDSQGLPNPGTPVDWAFADLDRRFHRLYEIACAECGDAMALTPDALAHMAGIAGAVPLDPIGEIETELPLGPIVELGLVEALLAERHLMLDPGQTDSVELDGFVRRATPMVH